MYLMGRLLRALAHGDAEEAHGLAVRLAERIQNSPNLLGAIAWWYGASNIKPHKVFGIQFPNRIGWAGGFDKGARTVLLMQALGFGFGEVGTVLPRPQAGRDKPRYFYLPEDDALINRFGFNSEGMNTVASRLRAIHPHLYIPLGINMGKMKDTPNEQAIEDYLAVWRALRQFGKFGVGNISSPNTEGLRDLQGGRYIEGFATRLVANEKILSQARGQAPRPMLLKIAPDLNDAELDETAEASERSGIAGIIIGNTTIARPKSLRSTNAQETGGLSGDPLYRIMTNRLRRLRNITKLPLVAVGGIDSEVKLRNCFDLGADLAQVFTGFVYKGPRLVSALRRID